MHGISQIKAMNQNAEAAHILNSQKGDNLTKEQKAALIEFKLKHATPLKQGDQLSLDLQ